MAERWLPVVGYEGEYSISDLGRVWSHKRNRLLSPWPNTDGYPQVGLSRGSAKRHRRVHTLILEAFVGPCPTQHEARHIDSNKCNCTLSNLEWAPTSVNMQDNVIRGVYNNGRLSDEQVRFIRSTPLIRGKTNDLCKQLGISRTTFHVVRRGEAYRHVGD